VTVDVSILAPAFEQLSEGAFGVSIKESDGGLLIERTDPIFTVDELAQYLDWSPATIRSMEKKGLLHAAKSKGRGGSLRFRKSRVVADLSKMESMN